MFKSSKGVALRTDVFAVVFGWLTLPCEREPGARR
jgi:hypothetical protein